MEEREEEGGVDLGTVLQEQVGHIDVAVLAGVGERRVARARGGVHPRAVLGEGVKEVEVTEVKEECDCLGAVQILRHSFWGL